jgi:hypothetical protein
MRASPDRKSKSRTHIPETKRGEFALRRSRTAVGLASLAFGIFPLVACTTTYHLRVRTYPPRVVSIFVDGELKGETSERGELRFSWTQSTVEGPVVEARRGEWRGLLKLRNQTYRSGALEGVAMVNASWLGSGRYASVVFSLVDIPIPEPSTHYSNGRNTISIRNASAVAVWVAASRRIRWLQSLSIGARAPEILPPRRTIYRLPGVRGPGENAVRAT